MTRLTTDLYGNLQTHRDAVLTMVDARDPPNYAADCELEVLLDQLFSQLKQMGEYGAAHRGWFAAHTVRATRRKRRNREPAIHPTFGRRGVTPWI